MAKAQLTTFYDGLTQPCTAISGNLNNVTLVPGTYCVGSAASNLTSGGTLTLNGNGLFLLRFADTFITSAGSQVLLTGGAQCMGVAYQVGSSATLEGGVVGNVIALTSITTTGANVNGRLLTRNAAVTTTSSSIFNTGCN